MYLIIEVDQVLFVITLTLALPIPDEEKKLT